MRCFSRCSLLAVGLALCAAAPAAPGPSADKAIHDLILRNGIVYDGSGTDPFHGDIVIDADRITYVGPDREFAARTEIDVKGQAIAPGFINMLAHPEESLFADGRALSDLMQGVTLEVMGEFSMGPLNPKMKELMVARQDDIKYPVTWSTLGEYLDTLERHGISPNVASFVGASTVRTFVLGESDVQPTLRSSNKCARWCAGRCKRARSGLTTMLIYAPATYAKTPELIALARESARCGGIYTRAHAQRGRPHRSGRSGDDRYCQPQAALRPKSIISRSPARTTGASSIE